MGGGTLKRGIAGYKLYEGRNGEKVGFNWGARREDITNKAQRKEK